MNNEPIEVIDVGGEGGLEALFEILWILIYGLILVPAHWVIRKLAENRAQ